MSVCVRKVPRVRSELQMATLAWHMACGDGCPGDGRPSLCGLMCNGAVPSEIAYGMAMPPIWQAEVRLSPDMMPDHVCRDTARSILGAGGVLPRGSLRCCVLCVAAAGWSARHWCPRTQAPAHACMHLSSTPDAPFLSLLSRVSPVCGVLSPLSPVFFVCGVFSSLSCVLCVWCLVSSLSCVLCLWCLVSSLFCVLCVWCLVSSVSCVLCVCGLSRFLASCRALVSSVRRHCCVKNLT